MLSFGPESFHGPVQRKNLGATKHEVRRDKALCLTLSLDIGELGQKPCAWEHSQGKTRHTRTVRSATDGIIRICKTN